MNSCKSRHKILNSLWISFFFVTLLFISICGGHLYLLQKTTRLKQRTVLISSQNLKNKQNLISVENVLLLPPYKQKDQNKLQHLSKLTKINIQVEMQDNKSLLKFKNQKLYIEEIIAVTLSHLTYQEISQKKIKDILKINIKETLNKFLFQGKVKDVHSISVVFL